MLFKSTKKITKKDNCVMIAEETYIEDYENEELGLKYENFRFDKKSMENMAKEAERIFENYEMEQELKALEEENYYALSEYYKTYSTLELLKKLFIR